MKKVVAWLLALVMVFALAGCSDGGMSENVIEIEGRLHFNISPDRFIEELNDAAPNSDQFELVDSEVREGSGWKDTTYDSKLHPDEKRNKGEDFFSIILLVSQNEEDIQENRINSVDLYMNSMVPGVGATLLSLPKNNEETLREYFRAMILICDPGLSEKDADRIIDDLHIFDDDFYDKEIWDVEKRGIMYMAIPTSDSFMGFSISTAPTE